jgi:hypothetical protein
VTSRLSAWTVGAALALVACHGSDAADATDAIDSSEQSREPVQFMLGTLDGGELSSDTTRGRTTALLFVTTYDLPSQAQAQLLRDVLSTHKPVANAAIVMMEPPHAAPLAQVWADSISVKLPIAMASPALLSGDSQLGRIVGVPTLLVLDRRGRVIARAEGTVSREAIAQALTRADSR